MTTRRTAESVIGMVVGIVLLAVQMLAQELVGRLRNSLRGPVSSCQARAVALARHPGGARGECSIPLVYKVARRAFSSCRTSWRSTSLCVMPAQSARCQPTSPLHERMPQRAGSYAAREAYWVDLR